MNIKLITRALELSDDDWELATKLRALSETERELLTGALGPQKPAAKKSSKKAGKKSAHAQSLGKQIQRQTRPVVSHGGQYCIAQIDDNGGLMECGEVVDHNIHHKQSDPDYHPFTPAASSAPPPSDQVSSEIGKGAAGDVHRAAGSGD